MRKGMLALVAAVLLVGCSTQTQKPTSPSADPTPTPTPQQPGGSGSSSDGNTPQEGGQVAEKTDAQIQDEIKAKLGRLTKPQTGYALPTGANGVVQEAKTLDDVTEMLRKKGYGLDLAKQLTQDFYQATADGTGVTLIAKDGRAGTFDTAKDCTFQKKNKWIWIITQAHPDDPLHGPNTATYEVEALKDGSYRLNSWNVQNL